MNDCPIFHVVRIFLFCPSAWTHSHEKIISTSALSHFSSLIHSNAYTKPIKPYSRTDFIFEFLGEQHYSYVKKQQQRSRLAWLMWGNRNMNSIALIRFDSPLGWQKKNSNCIFVRSEIQIMNKFPFTRYHPGRLTMDANWNRNSIGACILVRIPSNSMPLIWIANKSTILLEKVKKNHNNDNKQQRIYENGEENHI